MTRTAAAPARRRRAQRGSGEQLRDEIVTAATKLLGEADSAEQVSIRAVADAVGVTPPSIYLHFADKDELIGAVVMDVFAQLDHAMVSAAEGRTDPLDRLHAFGKAYITFALEHREHYRIATMDPCPRPPAVDEVLASGAFAHFSAAVVEAMRAGIFAEGDPLPITLQLWSAAHGIASLIIAKPYLPWGDIDAFVDRLLCASALGVAARGLIGGDPQPADVGAWVAQQKRSARTA